MKKILKYSIMLLFVYITAPLAYVLVMVDSDYYAHSQQKIDRYRNEILSIDGISSTLYSINPEGINQFDVWFILRDLYAAGHGTSAPLEGVVMIGDLPATVFHYGAYTMACEYFLMDLWKSNVTPQRPYNSWDEVWDIYSGESVERASYSTPIGDGVLDIWVSRIYSSNLLYLRAAGAAWGDFLEEYQILDNYFDRLHARMTARAKVPHNGFRMGPPPAGYGDLEAHVCMNNLGLDSVRTFNMSNLRLNQAAAWQAQLQAGPYGNNNYGAVNGVRFTDANYKRDCRTSYSGTAGYEWAALYAHSTPTCHTLHMYPLDGCYKVGGIFYNYNITNSWEKKTSGGYNNGLYYEWNTANNGVDPASNSAEWTCVIPSGKQGTYEVYMYWDEQPLINSDNSYFNLHGNKNFSKLDEGRLNQKTSEGTVWHKIKDTSYSCSVGDTLWFSFVPNLLGCTRSYRCVAGAVKFKKVSGTSYEIIVTPSNIFNITSRGTKGFRLLNWYLRSFHDMQDDGGQSKIPFFEIYGCSAGNYLVPDNIGLLYAMGHEGLSSFANSTPLYIDVLFGPYTLTLGNGGNFGEAYLSMAQSCFPDADDNFILFGAGTLYSDPYISY